MRFYKPLETLENAFSYKMAINKQKKTHLGFVHFSLLVEEGELKEKEEGSKNLACLIVPGFTCLHSSTHKILTCPCVAPIYVELRHDTFH